MLFDLFAKLPRLDVWGYVVVFAAAFLETLPGIGLAVPGQTLIIIAGFASQQGFLELPAVIALAIVGAFLGDIVAYSLGRQYGIGFLKSKEGMAHEVLLLIREHPVKTLIIGRFNSVTRAFAPFTAGMSGVRKGTFFVANVTGAIAWGTLWSIVGYVLGTSYSVASRWIDVVVLLAMMLATGGYFAYRYARRKTFLTPRSASLIAIMLASLGLFIWVLRSVIASGVFTRLDTAAYALALDIQAPLLTAVMLIATSLIQPLAVSAITLFGAFILWQRRRDAITLGVAMAGAFALDMLVKNLVGRPRPLDGILEIASYSFPSGHALIATTFALVFAFLYWDRTDRKTALVIGMTAGAALIALSRIYLRVHYASDVIAGISLGLVWSCFVLLAAAVHEHAVEKRRDDRTVLSPKPPAKSRGGSGGRRRAR